MSANVLTAPDAWADVGVQSVESELALIGACMFDPDACDEAMSLVRPEHLFDPLHATLYAAIRAIVAQGGRPSPPIIRDRMGGDPRFIEWGGLPLLMTVYDRASSWGVLDHARAIVDRAARRALRQVVRDVDARLPDTAGGSADDLIADLERGVSEIARDTSTRENWISAEDMITGAIDDAQTHDGTVHYPAGLGDVDELLGGFNAGEVSILAARPGMGKTVAAVQIAKASAARGLGTSMFSLEMSAGPLGLRLACDLAYDRSAPVFSGETSNPTFDRARRNQLSSDQWDRLRATKRHVAGWPLNFDTRPALSLAQIEAGARRAIRRWDKRGIEPGPVIVDHLGLIRPEAGRQGSRHNEVADISRGLSAMAKRLGVPVIALCQLNRGVEASDRRDKRPRLADLRQAGELEEDARQVIFLYRPEYYFRTPMDADGESFEERVEREAELARQRYKLHWIVAKNSHGPQGQVETFCDIGCSAIRDREAPR